MCCLEKFIALYFTVHIYFNHGIAKASDVGNYAAHHVHIFSCVLDKKRYYYHLLHTIARGQFHCR